MALDNTIAVIINGQARSGRHSQLQDIRKLESGRLQLYESSSRDIAHSNLAQILHQEPGLIYVFGGDGTAHWLLNDLLHHSTISSSPLPPLALHHAGTGGGLATSIGASRSLEQLTYLASLPNFNDLPITQIPLIETTADLISGARLHSHTFFAGTGWDAVVSQNYHQFRTDHHYKFYSRGLLGYIFSTLTRSIPREIRHNTSAQASLTFYRHPIYRLGHRHRFDAELINAPFSLTIPQAKVISASTIPYFGYRLRAHPYSSLGSLAPSSMFSLRILHGPTIPTLARLISHLPSIWRGDYRSSCLLDYLVSHVSVSYDQPINLHLAGDSQLPATHIHYNLSSRTIKLIDWQRIKTTPPQFSINYSQ